MKSPLILVFLSLLVFSLFACSSRENANEKIEVIDFEQGLIRENNGIYRVYEAGEKFKYKENGECVYNKAKEPCMWFGYTFRTKERIKKIPLSCEATLMVPDEIGNPEGVLAKGVQKVSARFTLESHNGIFSNPQYVINDNTMKLQKASVTCSYNGNELFKSNIEIKFSE